MQAEKGTNQGSTDQTAQLIKLHRFKLSKVPGARTLLPPSYINMVQGSFFMNYLSCFGDVLTAIVVVVMTRFHQHESVFLLRSQGTCYDRLGIHLLPRAKYTICYEHDRYLKPQIEQLVPHPAWCVPIFSSRR